MFNKKEIFTEILSSRYSSIKYIIKWLIICLIIGLLVGSASALFLISLEWATKIRDSNYLIIAILPLSGFFISWLYHYYGKNSLQGNNLLIDTIHNPENNIPLRMAPLVYIGTISSHIFGASVGREGTAVQMSGAISFQLSKLFRLNNTEKRTLLIAAISAGFASVFGTPLAGAIFGLEVFIIGKIHYRSIFPAFMAAIFANITTHYYNINHTYYSVGNIPDLNLQLIAYCIVAGIIFGLCALSFTKLMHLFSKMFKRISFAPLRTFVGGIIIILLLLIIGDTKYIGLGIETIVNAFSYQQVLYVFALKILFTTLSISAGFKGGEVTPLFFIGATLGSALSLLIPMPVALLAAMGFVAVFAGATNTPLACIIMGIELFGVESAIFTSIAIILSYIFSGHNSIYETQIIGISKNTTELHQEGRKINNK